jgi:hypothetical protein
VNAQILYVETISRKCLRCTSCHREGSILRKGVRSIVQSILRDWKVRGSFSHFVHFLLVVTNLFFDSISQFHQLLLLLLLLYVRFEDALGILTEASKLAELKNAESVLQESQRIAEVSIQILNRISCRMK